MPILEGLLEKYTPQEIWDVGKQVLGWPPTWMPSMNQVVMIAEAIERRRKEQ